ncbi:alanine racemase [Alteraurantiacibacter aestuarii]|uniref:alanine racemase n=1 Tax=Alteraurantiacibacter aestuarii TaxID=650004 RepID=UPI0031D46512
MTIPDLPPATLRLRIDAQALAANWRALDTMSGSASTGAAVKADGYGVGAEQVVPVLRDAGARHFFVAHWSEVPAVLRHVPASQVSVLHGVISDREAAFARATGVTPVINSVEQAAIWNAAGGGACHLMVDSGINRLGIRPSELGEGAIERLQVDILMSHLASADEDTAQNRDQLEVFRTVTLHKSARAYSLANSAGIALGPDYAFDLTRPGLSLYGGIARPELAGRISQVVYPEAAVLQAHDLQAGDKVGYNAIYTASAPIRTATISLGYADGFLRCRGPGAALQHEGRELPILGRVSMDMVVIDCTGSPELKNGDFVQVPFDIHALSMTSKMSQYELLTSLGKRFSRN